MAALELRIAGRDYPIVCRDGDEPRILAIGARLAEKAEAVRRLVGDVNEGRLLLYAAILMADELEQSGTGSAEGGAVPVLTAVAERLEELASQLEKPGQPH